MNKWVITGILAAGSTCLSVGILLLPFSLSMVKKNEFVFGNFQSYMNPKVQNELNKEYHINWQYYSSNSEIPTYIENKTLDIAVATNNMICQLLIDNQIQPIQWNRFGLINPKTNQPITSYTELEGIVTDATWNLCTTIGEAIDLPSGNLLEYCIPYFMQNFVFAYHGSKIDSLNDNSSFKEIFDYIANSNISDNRFLNGNSSVMMIQDPRTVYDVCRLINATNNMDVNINPNEKSVIKYGSSYSQYDGSSINDIYNEYKSIIDYYNTADKRNSITFNSDSSVVLNKFANNEINGAFFYNGDAIYSAQGGDYGISADDILSNGMNIIIPENNFLAMDGIVFNKSLSGEKLDKAYDIAYNLCLSGLNELSSSDLSNESMMLENNIDVYEYMSVANFDYVNYTPCYKSLYDWVLNDYFSSNAESESENIINKICKKLIQISPENARQKGLIELPLNNYVESNMNIAFFGFMNNV